MKSHGFGTFDGQAKLGETSPSFEITNVERDASFPHFGQEMIAVRPSSVWTPFHLPAYPDPPPIFTNIGS